MERSQRGYAIPQRAFLRNREHVTALLTGEIAAGAILFEHEITLAVWAGSEQQHRIPPVTIHGAWGVLQRAGANVRVSPAHPAERHAWQGSAVAAR